MPSRQDHRHPIPTATRSSRFFEPRPKNKPIGAPEQYIVHGAESDTGMSVSSMDTRSRKTRDVVMTDDDQEFKTKSSQFKSSPSHLRQTVTVTTDDDHDDGWTTDDRHDAQSFMDDMNRTDQNWTFPTEVEEEEEEEAHQRPTFLGRASLPFPPHHSLS